MDRLYLSDVRVAVITTPLSSRYFVGHEISRGIFMSRSFTFSVYLNTSKKKHFFSNTNFVNHEN